MQKPADSGTNAEAGPPAASSGPRHEKNILTDDELEAKVAERVKQALANREVQKEPSMWDKIRQNIPFLAIREPAEAKPEDLFRFLMTPSQVVIYPDHACFNEMRHRVIQAGGYPRNVEDAWLYSFLSKNEDYDVSMHIEPMPIDDTLEYLHNQIIAQETDLYMSKIKGTPNPALETKLADTNLVYNILYTGKQKIFRNSFYFDNKADTMEKLNFLTEKCKSNLNALMIMPKSCTYRMAQAMRSCLPIGEDEMKIQQEFMTHSLAASIPFISSSCTTHKGVLLGKEEETKTPVFIDFDSLPNKHFFVLGTSGSGKSYTAKYLMIQLFIAMDARIYVLDPNSEYKEMCEKFGGQTIELSRHSKSIINIFDLANEDFGSKMLSLISVFDIIVGGLSESQKGVLNRLLLATYKLKGIVQNDPSTWKKEPPTFSDFHRIVEKWRKDEARSDKSTSKQETRSLEVLSNRTAMYTKNGFFGFLDSQTQIDMKQRFINFDLSKLPSAVRTLMMFAVLDFLVREIKKDTQPKVLLIDEGWALLRSKEVEGYLLDFVKTSRKFGTSMGFITQELEDLLTTEGGRSILNQTSTKILMHQNTTNIDLISDNLKLNPSEKDFLIKCGKGHGLLISGDDRTRFFTKPSKGVHDMITTDPAEVIELGKKKHLEEVGSTKHTFREEEQKRWGGKPKLPFDTDAEYYKCADLNKDQIAVLQDMGYEEENLEPFDGGRGPKWLVKPHGNQSATHALLVLLVRDEIRKHCEKVILHDTVEPDIVAMHKGKKIAFEIETGSWVETKGPKLEERFRKLRAKYPDGYYIIVTHADYEPDYAQFATVITKPKIKEMLVSILV